MTKRNNLVELARFLFSILVIGYHVQLSFGGNAKNLFENGALAVEFFFLISGYFFARSMEKIHTAESNVVSGSGRFMANKVKGILPAHLTAVIMMIAVILSFDINVFGSKLLSGLPSIFLVQEAVIWNEAYANALIVPEWYLSAMLVCMLIMMPVALLLRKKLKGVLVIPCLLGVLGVIAILYGLCADWAFTTTFVYDLRAWGEMCLGMLAYYLSALISEKQIKKATSISLKVAEIAGYSIPVILGIIPIGAGWQPVCMAVTVVGVFAAITVTFAGKGVVITNSRINVIFGWLGKLSLAMYLFHPVVISLLDYAYKGMGNGVKYLIVFAATLLLAVVFNLLVYCINRLVKHIKCAKSAA